jgi:hypothetical protein
LRILLKAKLLKQKMKVGVIEEDTMTLDGGE